MDPSHIPESHGRNELGCVGTRGAMWGEGMGAQNSHASEELLFCPDSMHEDSVAEYLLAVDRVSNECIGPGDVVRCRLDDRFSDRNATGAGNGKHSKTFTSSAASLQSVVCVVIEANVPVTDSADKTVHTSPSIQSHILSMRSSMPEGDGGNSVEGISQSVDGDRFRGRRSPQKRDSQSRATGRSDDVIDLTTSTDSTSTADDIDGGDGADSAVSPSAKRAKLANSEHDHDQELSSQRSRAATADAATCRLLNALVTSELTIAATDSSFLVGQAVVAHVAGENNKESEGGKDNASIVIVSDGETQWCVDRGSVHSLLMGQEEALHCLHLCGYDPPAALAEVFRRIRLKQNSRLASSVTNFTSCRMRSQGIVNSSLAPSPVVGQEHIPAENDEPRNSSSWSVVPRWTDDHLGTLGKALFRLVIDDLGAHIVIIFHALRCCRYCYCFFLVVVVVLRRPITLGKFGKSFHETFNLTLNDRHSCCHVRSKRNALTNH